jgi:hypothetical protein
MHHIAHTLILTFTFTFTVGCVLDPNTADDLVSTETSAVFTTCNTGTWCNETPQTPQVTPRPLLHAVWAASASDVFAVGEGGTIWRRSSTAWTAMTSGTSSKLLGVWGTSSSNVWAVGVAGTILHFNGTAWSVITGVTTSDLDAVWGSSSTDVWFAATGAVLHWNGSAFSASAFSTSASFAGHLLSVSGTGPSDVWATGELTNLHHYDGTTWWPVNPGAGTSTFYAVLAVAPGDVWCTDFNSPKDAMHLTGGNWVAKSPGATFNSLAAFSANDIWGVGSSTTIGHWNGTSWTTSQPVGSIGNLWSVTTAPSHVWTVGDGGLILHQPL